MYAPPGAPLCGAAPTAAAAEVFVSMTGESTRGRGMGRGKVLGQERCTMHKIRRVKKGTQLHKGGGVSERKI